MSKVLRLLQIHCSLEYYTTNQWWTLVQLSSLNTSKFIEILRLFVSVQNQEKLWALPLSIWHCIIRYIVGFGKNDALLFERFIVKANHDLYCLYAPGPTSWYFWKEWTSQASAAERWTRCIFATFFTGLAGQKAINGFSIYPFVGSVGSTFCPVTVQTFGRLSTFRWF